MKKANSGSFKKGNPPWNKGLKGVQVAWCKGLTKETSSGLLINSLKHKGKKCPWTSEWNRKHKRDIVQSRSHRRKNSEALKRARASYAPIWNKGLTKETNASVARIAEKISNRPNPNAPLSGKFGTRRFWFYGKSGYRIKLRSRWEIAYAHWLDSQKIEWIYEPVCFVADTFSYLPDFYLLKSKEFIEIKGRILELPSINKLEVVRERYGIKISLLSAKDLHKMGVLKFEAWEKRKYGIE